MSKNKSEDRLRTMTKNSTRHIVRQFIRVLKYGVIGFGRNIWLSITATIVTTLTLVLLFATIIAGVVLSSTADAMREKIDITIYFQSKATKLDLADMGNIMAKDENVKSVEFSTSEEEFNKLYEGYVQENNEKMIAAIDMVGRDAFIKKQPAAMRIKVYDTDNLSSVKSIVNTNEKFIENISEDKAPTYNTNSSAISTISSWANIATKGGVALCILFLVISTLVIFNTIRMAIYSRSEEIYMEKLVGAGNGFIRGPFLVEAMMSGIGAGILSSIIGFVAYNALSPKLQAYEISVSAVNSIFSEPRNITLVVLALIGTGMIITLISSRLAVHKYLKKF